MSNPLDQYQWKNRILLIFAQSQSPANEQIDIWEDQEGLQDRDLLIFQISPNIPDKSDSSLNSKEMIWLQERYNPENKKYKVILIGKDGYVKLEKNDFLEQKDLFSTIDAMPMRQREMKED